MQAQNEAGQRAMLIAMEQREAISKAVQDPRIALHPGGDAAARNAIKAAREVAFKKRRVDIALGDTEALLKRYLVTDPS